MAKTSRKEYSEDFRVAVVKALSRDLSQAQVSIQFDVPQQYVSRWNQAYKHRGTLKSKARPGRPRKTGTRVDSLIKRKAVANPPLTAIAINDDLRANYGVELDVTTVRRRLRDVGLTARRPSRKPLVSAKNRQARVVFAKKYLNWTTEDWARVLWSDESKFNLFSSDGIQYVRRPVNQRDNIRYQVPTVKHGGGNVMVWGCFSRKEVGPLCRIQGKMDRFVYRSILAEHMISYAEENLPAGWVFQQDNDPKHTSKLVREFFGTHSVEVLDWPSQSPDLNPIEHMWEELERRVRAQNYSNLDDFFEALKKEWAQIPRSRNEKLIESMPRRCEAVIRANGYATKY